MVTPQTARYPACLILALGKFEAVSFANCSCLLLAAKTINHNQDFVGANGRIAAEILIADVKEQSSLADARPKNVRDVDRVSLHAVIAAKDLEVSIPVVVSISIVVAAAIAVGEIVARRRRRRYNKHSCVDEAALAEIKLAFFAAAISRDDVKSFVLSDSGIATHGLVAHRNTAIKPAAGDQIAKQIGDIHLRVSEAVQRADEQPTVVLRGRRRHERRNFE